MHFILRSVELPHQKLPTLILDARNADVTTFKANPVHMSTHGTRHIRGQDLKGRGQELNTCLHRYQNGHMEHLTHAYIDIKMDTWNTYSAVAYILMEENIQKEEKS